MNVKEFESMFESIVDNSRTVLVEKAKEYANEEDVMVNFKQAAGAAGTNIIDVLVGMMRKHYISIECMRHDPFSYAPEAWREKLGDLRNYSILAEAIIMENEENEDDR